MPTRKVQFAPGEHYHLYGRGVAKQKLFLDTRDYVRFLFLILYFQSPKPIYNTSTIVSSFIKHNRFNVTKETIEKIIKNRIVALVSFTPMPNHFHLIVEETEEGGISTYMQKVLVAYANYFNAKYKKSGHVFQGPFQAVHIKDNRQLLYTSAYIHRNSRELRKWKNKEVSYPWSSYQDCVKENRWGKLLKTDLLVGQFKNGKEYDKYVKTSGAKEVKS